MNKMNVAKFGGTSVGSADAIRQVVTLIEQNKTFRLVVLSAVGGVTNKLIALFNAPENEREALCADIVQLHRAIAADLKVPLTCLEPLFQELKTHITGAQSSDRLDALSAMGERLSSALIQAYMESLGIKTTLLDARKIIITDAHFGKATPDLDQIKARTKAYFSQLPEDTVVLTQGFIGATPTGETTTLGRGGSDLSAALFAEALNAECLYIYTDVKGVFTMDPNIIPSAQLISRLSFQEMAELANFGAKVLHPATIAPCIRAKIPVVIASTFEPEPEHTLIAPDDLLYEGVAPFIRAIALRKKQTLVTIKSLSMLDAHGFLAKVFEILARYKISVDLITTSEVKVALTIDGTSTSSHLHHPFANPEVMQELTAFSEIAVEEDLTLITLVGAGLTARPGVTQKILGTMVDFPIRLICYGASASNMSILVFAQDAHNIAGILHNTYIKRRALHV